MEHQRQQRGLLQVKIELQCINTGNEALSLSHRADGNSHGRAAEAENTCLINLSLSSLCCRFLFPLSLFMMPLPLICVSIHPPPSPAFTHLSCLKKNFLNQGRQMSFLYSVFNLSPWFFDCPPPLHHLHFPFTELKVQRLNDRLKKTT